MSETYFYERIQALTERLERLERKVEFILMKLELEYDEAVDEETLDKEAVPAYLAEVEELLSRGNKIGAIKVYRYNTGVGLQEAMVAVETIARQRRG